MGRMVTVDDNKGLSPTKDFFLWRIFQPMLLALMVASASGLRDVQVSVPEAAAAGDTVALYCRFDLESEILYSVKWYRGKFEFFRYIPKELPHTRVFPLDGIDVDLGRSGPSIVVLRNVSPPLSGRYRCEVSADAPSFHTAMKTSYMHVVELPEAAPIIYSDKTKVSIGDTLKVRCIAPPAHPPANLTWTVNGKIIKGLPVTVEQNESKTLKLYQLNFTENSHIDKIEDSRKGNDHSYPFIYPNENDQRWISSEFTNNLSKMSETPPTKSKPDNEIVKKKSGSLLVIPISQSVFIQNQLRIICKATVFTLYTAEAHLVLDEDKPQIAQILGNTQTPNRATFAFVSFSTLVLCILATLTRYRIS